MLSELVWLVTGCSSGFGEQFVHSIVARGDKVIATGRNLSKLQNLSNTGASLLQLDVTNNQESIDKTVAEAMSIHGRIDVLVNNAAFIQVGTIEDLSVDDFRSQFETNVFGTLKVTKAVLPHFRERRSGTNIFISSLSGWIGHDFCGPYASSKFAVEGFVESLWRETSPLGIRTLLIEPGRFRTKLLSGSNRHTTASAIPDYADMSNSKTEGLAGEDMNQPGDPVKLVEIILDLVRQEGIAEGKEVPFRMPLGVDVFDDIKAKCEETLELLGGWEAVIRSTDFAA